MGNGTMATLFQHAAESGLEWIAMGDWNTKPEEMQATEWCCKKRIHVRSTAEPTCHPSTGEDSYLDYALVSTKLEHVFSEAMVDKGIHGIKTHEPICIQVRAPADWPDVEYISAPAPGIGAARPIWTLVASP